MSCVLVDMWHLLKIKLSFFAVGNHMLKYKLMNKIIKSTLIMLPVTIYRIAPCAQQRMTFLAHYKTVLNKSVWIYVFTSHIHKEVTLRYLI